MEILIHRNLSDLKKIPLDSTKQYKLVQVGFELYEPRYNQLEQIQGDSNYNLSYVYLEKPINLEVSNFRRFLRMIDDYYKQ